MQQLQCTQQGHFTSHHKISIRTAGLHQHLRNNGPMLADELLQAARHVAPHLLLRWRMHRVAFLQPSRMLLHMRVQLHRQRGRSWRNQAAAALPGCRPQLPCGSLQPAQGSRRAIAVAQRGVRRLQRRQGHDVAMLGRQLRQLLGHLIQSLNQRGVAPALRRAQQLFALLSDGALRAMGGAGPAGVGRLRRAGVAGGQGAAAGLLQPRLACMPWPLGCCQA